MIKTKTTCDKCGKEIEGKIYKVNVEFTEGWDLLQIPKYQSYDICPECMEIVITNDVIGNPFKWMPSLSPYCYCYS